MLTKFKVKGFKNFKKEFSINFRNTRDYKFNENCVKNKILKNIIMYGKNSVGKSNLGLAIMDIVAHLDDKNIGTDLYSSYINLDSELAEFSYEFQFNKDIIKYNYSKKDLKNLVYEKLELNNELILFYDYTSDEGDFVGADKISPTLNYEFSGDNSKLKYFLTNSSMNDRHPLYLFTIFVSKMLWFRTLEENRYIGYKTKSDDYYKLILDDTNLRKEFEILLNSVGVEGKLSARKNVEGVKALYFNRNEKFLPFFKTASSGTKALYTFFYWLNTAKDASFICIDEFDAYYHFELAEKIIKILIEMKNTQSIVTTHNTNLLTNKLMRPDCYFVLTNKKMTSIANATKMELREGHNLEKLYMAGEFNE